MPGYLRPHSQTIVPGRDDPKYGLVKDTNGRWGTYWIELTFQQQPMLQSNYQDDELRSGFIGDSHILISKNLSSGTINKHVFTIKELSTGHEHYIYCNEKGRLSHINLKIEAANFSEAINVTQKSINPLLSAWSAKLNVPLFVF